MLLIQVSPPILQPAVCTRPSLSLQQFSGKGPARTFLLLSGTSHPGKGKFGPIALLWLPKRGYSRVSPAVICRSGTC